MSVPGKFLINIVIPKIFKMNLSGTKRTKLHPLNMGCQGAQSAPCLPKFRNNPLSTFFRLPSGSSETSIIRPPSLKIDRFKIVQHYKINITYFSVFVFFLWGVGEMNEENHAAGSVVCGLGSEDRSDVAALMNGPTCSEASSCRKPCHTVQWMLMLAKYMRWRLVSEKAACKSHYGQLVKDGELRKLALNLHYLT